MKLIRLKETVNLSVGPELEETKNKILNVLESSRYVVIPKIEAIHAKVTRNYTFYPQVKLRGNPNFVDEEGRVRPTGVHSWTKPYYKPMLKNHNIFTDPLGRITKAEYKAKTSIGVPGIICYPEITDPEAIERVLDGRYSTVSIGADADSAFCSICNQNQLEGRCDHRRGKTYGNELCFWKIGNIWFIELSYVNAPSDEHANTIEVPELETNGPKEESAELGFLLQDLKENKLYDLNCDIVYAVKEDQLIQIPKTEFIKEYYYIPFNVREEDNVHTKEPANTIEIGEASSDKGKDGKPINKMQTGTKKQAYYGHNLLHGWWRQPSKTDWTRDQIKREHARVVRIIFNKGWSHHMIDSLDKTLPSDLQKRSRAQDASKSKRKEDS